MTLNEAREWITARSKAALGLPADTPDNVHRLEIKPDEHMRKLLVGVVPDGEIEPIIEGSFLTSANAMHALAHSESSEEQLCTLALLFAQTMAMGVKVGQG